MTERNIKIATCAFEASEGRVTMLVNKSLNLTMSTRQAEFAVQLLVDAIHVSKLSDIARNAINTSSSNKRLVKTLEANGIVKQGGGRIR